MTNQAVVHQHLTRQGGHPWDGERRPGFDLLEIHTEDKAACDLFVERAKKNFWSVWLVGMQEGGAGFGGLLYKPSGIDHPWEDTPQKPHPGHVLESSHFSDRPCAAPGLVSYRCKGRFGWIMIGARDAEDALREAKRSSDSATAENLQVWDGSQYVPVP